MRHALGAVALLLRLIPAIALVGSFQAPEFPPVRDAAAWQRAAHKDAPQDAENSDDPGEIEAAWDRAGCQLNPGNPACVLLGRAASCDIADRDPACTSDVDTDGCLDISEVLAGLDPLNGKDCLGDAAGTPLLNCLFPHSNASCQAGSDDQQTPLDCPLPARDPLCDGFGP